MLNHPDYAHPDARRRLFNDVRVQKARSRELVDLLLPPAAVRAVDFEVPDDAPVLTGGAPVRYFMRPGKGKSTGYFPSRKNRETLVWESYAEKAAFRLLECDAWVSAYYPQPLTLEYPWYRGPRTYTPDLFVWRDDQPYVIEVKWAEKAADPEFKELFEFFEAFFAARKVVYQVWTERHIYAPPRQENARWLLRYRKQLVRREQRLVIERHLMHHGRACIQELAGLLDTADGRAIVYALILRGRLLIDMNQQLTEESAVWLFGDAR